MTRDSLPVEVSYGRTQHKFTISPDRLAVKIKKDFEFQEDFVKNKLHEILEIFPEEPITYRATYYDRTTTAVTFFNANGYTKIIVDLKNKKATKKTQRSGHW